MKTLIIKLLPLIALLTLANAEAQYSISGPTSADINDTKTYTVSNSGSLLGKNWSVASNKGNVVSGQQSSTAQIQFTQVGNAIVNFSAVTPGTFNSVFLSRNVNVAGSVVGNVTITAGPTSRCQGSGSSDFNASANNATSYNWSISPITAGSINGSGTVTWNSNFFGNATVQVTANGPNNSTSTASRIVSVVTVSTPSLQANINEICSGEQVVLTMGPLQSSVRYQLLRNGTVTGQEVTTDSNGQPGGISWNVFSGGTYSVRGTKQTSPSCSRTWANLVIDENAGLGNPSINGPSQLCSGTVQTDFNISGNNGTNTYVWSILNGGPATINSSTGVVTWNGATSTATIRLTATSECGTTTNINKSVSFDLISTPGLQANMNEFCTGDQVMLTLGPLQSSVRYELLKDGIFTGFEVTTDSNGQPGGTSWDVSSGGTYSIRATKSTGLNCSITYGSLPLIEKANLGNPVLSDPGTRCRQTGTSSLSVTGGSSANTYFWTLTNAGSSTINSSGTSATVNWPADFSGTATVRVDATSECGTTTVMTRSISVTEPDIWYADTDGDNYEDPGGATQQSCTAPAGNWTNNPQGPDQCPLQPAPGAGTNGCDPDCALGWVRVSDSGTPNPNDPFTPTQFDFPQQGGIAFAELAFPNDGCSPVFELELPNFDSWATVTVEPNNKIKIEVGTFVSINGSSTNSTGGRVFVNGTHIGIIGISQSGPPVFPTCDVSVRVDGVDVEPGVDINYGIASETKSIQVVFDPAGCDGDVQFGDDSVAGNLPDWLTITPTGSSNTFNFETEDNNTGFGRTGFIGIYNQAGEMLGLFRISQISCMDMEWYPDQDGDGQGDATAVPRGGCDAPTDETYNFVKNNNDLCPFEAGTFENQGCPPGSAPENLNTITTLSYDLNENLKVGSKSYFDELGKLEQTQAWDIKSDSIWASANLYDEFGRPSVQTLSSPIRQSSNFQFKEGFIKKTDNTTDYSLSDFDGVNTEEPLPVGAGAETLGWYYSENNNREGYQDVTDYPFSKSIYSNLNPDGVLRTVGGNKINGEWPQGYSFTMKASEELSQSVAFGDTNYNNMEITKIVTRDVHGVENVIFTDTDGKILAAARSGGTTPSSLMFFTINEQGFADIHVSEGITNGFSINNPSETTVYDLITEEETTVPEKNLPPGIYRVSVNDLENYDPQTNPIVLGYRVNYYDYSLNEYDEADRLIASYQPLGTTKAEKPVTTYSYNTVGELSSTTSPDQNTTDFKYREDGQIRFSQNSKQKDPNGDGDFSDGEFSYTNYDIFGRPVENGVCKEGAITFANADSLLENVLEDISFDNDGLVNSDCSEQTFILYDQPDTVNLHTALTASSIPTTNYEVQKFITGKVSKTYTVESGVNVTTWYSYDSYGRLSWIIQNIEGLGTKTTDYEYNPITGQVLKVYYQNDSPNERFIHRYMYNEGDQLVTVETSTDDFNFTIHAEYTYYETGAMKRTELAGGVQGIDYVYNLAGQLKSLNHPSLDTANDPNGDANDLFGMQIDYHADDYKRNVPNITSQTYGTDRLNGSIKGVRWKNNAIPAATTELMYAYDYDRNNWLQSADFDGDGAIGDEIEGIVTSIAVVENAQNLDLEATQSITLLSDSNGDGFHAKEGSDFSAKIIQGSGGGTIMDGDYDVSNLTYDANGNILSLKRNKGSDGAGNAMDDLAYNYKPGTNQLQQIVDGEGNVSDADDLGTQIDPDNYVYNSIGQLIENKAEGLTYLYDANGLVSEIRKNSLTLVKYFYNDRNQRVRKDVYDGLGVSVVKTTHYVRDVAGSVMAIYTDNVLVEHYIYGYSRLGVAFQGSNNNRSYVYELTDHLGNIRATFSDSNNAESASDYYPYGMQMPGRKLVSDYRYKFQGQEKDEETEKEAFELRQWDSRIGRWLSIDPAAQYYSPYLGMGNDPLNGIDPNGGKFVRGAGVTVAQFEAWKKRIKALLGTNIFDYLEKHPTPITINFLNRDPQIGLNGETLNSRVIKGPLGKSLIVNHVSILRLPIKNGNNNNAFLDKVNTNFIALSIPDAEEKFEVLSFDEVRLKLNGKVSSTGFTVNVNAKKPFSTFGDELGHVYEALQNPVETYIYSLVERSLNFQFRERAGHALDDPSGIRANIFEKKIDDQIGDKVINPRDF